MRLMKRVKFCFYTLTVTVSLAEPVLKISRVQTATAKKKQVTK